MAEQWRSVEGFPGYLVSDAGRVVGRRGHVLSPGVCPRGYTRVVLMRDAKRYNRSIHRLVLRAFADAPGDSGIVGAHLNGDPRDNRLANLRWVSQSENLSHRKEHGTELLGERNGRAKLTEDDVRTIRKLADLGRTCASLADEYDVRYGTVNKVITRESWRHVA